MKKISALSWSECQQTIAKIISDFGDGNFKRDRYVFDQITRVPAGFLGQKLITTALRNHLKSNPELLVIFDPIPQNAAYRLNVTYQLGFDDDVWGLRLGPEEFARCLGSSDCDLYITSPSGDLLAVASHEDEFRENERLFWCPIAHSEINQ